MSFLNEAYQRIHEYYVEKKLRKEAIKRQPNDFAKSQSIGILFDASMPESLDIIRKYVQRLEKKGKKVNLLAFFDDKDRHEHFPYKHFTRKEIDWRLCPKGSAVEHFINQPFDVLINLCYQPSPPLEYITALAKAHMRVGPYTERTYCYDLMIELANQRDLHHFIQQIDFFLNRMNSSQHEQKAT
ncbi:MAG: hypothetical protein AAFP19_14795 [Bacteroidota bacterium]